MSFRMTMMCNRWLSFRLFVCWFLLVSYLAVALPGRGLGVAFGQIAGGRCTSALQSSSSSPSSVVEECITTATSSSSNSNADNAAAASLSPSERIIRNFLDGKKSNTNASLENFHIHGWRWHTLSLVRETGRLKRLASKTKAENNGRSTDDCDSLKQATDYVIGFNLRGLHSIEADLFFPWMKEKLVAVEERDLSKAFETVMDQLEDDRKKVAKLGVSIKQSVSLACDTTKSVQIREEAIQNVVDESSELESYTKSMMDVENTYLVPSIAQIVPKSEQKSFNNKVLLNLGLLESRLHLVGMYEAVQESNDELEQQLFEQAIPSISQMMIPRWKRKLYDPKTSVFD